MNKQELSFYLIVATVTALGNGLTLALQLAGMPVAMAAALAVGAVVYVIWRVQKTGGVRWVIA